MALGAFLAGMMFAETEYRHQIEAVIRPFRELLLGLFFISVGMLLNLRLLYAEFAMIFGLLALHGVRQGIAVGGGDPLLRTEYASNRCGPGWCWPAAASSAWHC